MNILTKATVLVLNRNWQAINVRTPQEAFCMMATNVATALEVEFDDAQGFPLPGGEGQGEGEQIARITDDDRSGTRPSVLHASSIRPVTWDEWITLPIRDQDEAVHTVRGRIRVPTVVVAVNYARVPKK